MYILSDGTMNLALVAGSGNASASINVVPPMPTPRPTPRPGPGTERDEYPKPYVWTEEFRRKHNLTESMTMEGGLKDRGTMQPVL